MQTPHRLLRADAQEFDRNPPPLSERELARHDRILDLGRSILARRGRHAVSFTGLAAALRIGPPTLRRHFPDLNALLGAILRAHLRRIAVVIGKIPHTAADRNKQRRAAYLAFTRTALGGFTEAHLLLVRDRHTLPDDILPAIEETRHSLGRLLAGGLAYEALSHLDNPFISPARIEVILALSEPAETIAEPVAAEPVAAETLPPRPPALARSRWYETTTLANEKAGSCIYAAAIPKMSRGPPAAR